MLVHGKIAPAHSDDRRAISEFNSPEGGFSIQEFVIKERIPLGNHFHKKKTETFIIHQGGGTLISQEVDENGETKGERQNIPLEAPSVVLVPPYTAHTFILDPGSTMSCYSSTAFNENDKDMTPLKLV